MSLLSIFANGAIRGGAKKSLAEAGDWAKIARSNVSRAKALKAGGRVESAAKATSTAKAARGAARASRTAAKKANISAGKIESFDQRFVDPIMRPVASVARGAGSVAIGAGRIAGAGANVVARHPRAWGVGLAGAGVVAGVGSGIRDSARSINSALGDPAGSYASMSVRTAFMGNPSNSRSKRGGASGNITLNSR